MSAREKWGIIELNEAIINLENNKNISLRLNKSAKKILLQEGSFLDWGARPIRRVIQNKIESEISIRFLDGQFIDDGGNISISG